MPKPRSERFKRVCDVLISLTISIVAIPMIAAAWVVVRLTSSGPGFYSQLRVGRNGRVFRIYKIRTMYHNCEAVSGVKWCTKNDPRVMFVGRLLRKFHIDELPQLWNVLRGDMSLVGPRPERPEFVGPLAAQIPGYAERLTVRPGVTGLAQIQLPPDTDIDSVRRKLMFDQCYVRTGSIWLDLRIILGTVVYLLGFSYSAVRKAMLLPNPLADFHGGHSAGSQPPSSRSTRRSQRSPTVVGRRGAPILARRDECTPELCASRQTLLEIMWRRDAGDSHVGHNTSQRRGWSPMTNITTLLVTSDPLVVNNVQRLHDEMESARLEVCGRLEKVASRLGRDHCLLLVHGGAGRGRGASPDDPHGGGSITRQGGGPPVRGRHEPGPLSQSSPPIRSTTCPPTCPRYGKSSRVSTGSRPVLVPDTRHRATCSTRSPRPCSASRTINSPASAGSPGRRPRYS